MIKEMIRLPKNIIERESIKDLKKFVKQTRFQLSPDQKSIVKKIKTSKETSKKTPKKENHQKITSVLLVVTHISKHSMERNSIVLNKEIFFSLKEEISKSIQDKRNGEEQQ